jgi:hypothetical protein
VTENGDCQLIIAEDAGADPVKTYTQLNNQFADPNLTHAGDVVFADATTRHGGEVAPDGSSNTNVGLFGDRIYSEAPEVSTGDGRRATGDGRRATGQLHAAVRRRKG